MARPRARDPKTRSTRVRLTDAEFAAFEEAAQKIGTVRARVMRRAVREIITRGPDLFDDGLAEFNAMRRELAAIGRNLNQITRAINSGDEPELRHIEAVTMAVSDQVERVEGQVARVVKNARTRWVSVRRKSGNG
jgi:hypothetical protein